MFGYDEPWPKEENYEGFLDDFIKGLERIGNKRTSFMIYGSVARGNPVFGRSDIDSIVTFDYDVVIGKEEFMAVSQVLGNALLRYPVKIQLTPQDTATMRDGRLFTFGDSFDGYFEEEGKVLFGTDYRNEMNFVDKKSEVISTLGFNLRKIRQQLIMSGYDKQHNHQEFVENFGKSISSIADISKKITYLTQGKMISARFNSIDELMSLYPGIDIEPLLKIKHLFHNLDALSALYNEPPDIIIDFWKQALTCYESIIKRFIYASKKE